MNRGDIETLAVTAVTRQVTLCNLLAPYISDKDKEPCWDGFIYIYQNEKKTIGSSVNRVAVQIKGTEKSDFSKETIKTRVDIADLKSYLNVHGTMYFVVYVNGPESKIYYVDFTPVRIRDILGRASQKQKTIAVELQELPQDIKEIESIVINFADHCKRQASFSDTKLVTMDELSKTNGPFRLSLFFSGHETEDPFGAVLKHVPYLYLESDFFPIPQPLGTIPVEVECTEVLPASITIEGHEYYDSYRKTRTKDKLTIGIGNSFTLKLDYKEGKNTTIKYKPSEYLRVRSRDLEFMLAFIDNSGFELNGSDFKYKTTDRELEKFEVAKQREHLHYCKSAVQALDRLNCAGDLDLSSLSKDHMRNLNYLITAFVDNEPVKGLLSNLPLLVSVHVGEYKFALVFRPDVHEPGVYTVRDLFEEKMNVFSIDENHEEYRVSQYIVLTSDDFLTLTNLKAELILPSLKDVPPHPQFLLRANMMLLEVLNAFDMAQERKDLLDLALGIAKWLNECNIDDVLFADMVLLNLYQTVLRIRALNQEEKDTLLQVTARSNGYPNILAGAYILLDRQTEAKEEFLKLDENAQNEFKKYPIHNLLKEKW